MTRCWRCVVSNSVNLGSCFSLGSKIDAPERQNARLAAGPAESERRLYGRLAHSARGRVDEGMFVLTDHSY